VRDRHPPEDRWCVLDPDDECEHKHLRITAEGIRCYSCDKDLGKALYSYFRRGADEPRD
jgi:hypothetical protein